VGDVVLDSQTDGQVLTYSAGNWVNKDPVGGDISALSAIVDVVVAAASGLDVLTWLGSSSEWVPKASPSATINELSSVIDVVCSGSAYANDRDVLTWIGSESHWQPAENPSATVTDLSSVGDVYCPSGCGDDSIVWVASASRWEARNRFWVDTVEPEDSASSGRNGDFWFVISATSTGV
jgi:hypothetical protein